MAACGFVDTWWDEVTIGVGYKWGGDPDFLTGCDFGPYSEQSREQVLSGRTTIGEGLPVVAFAVTGESAPPAFTLVEPNGERVDAAEEGSTPGGALVVTNPATNTTYVALPRPAPGDWTIEVHKESSPVSSVRRSDGMPKPDVSGSVELQAVPLCLSCPDKAALSWNVTPPAG